jgi:hypothetical protein
VKRTPPSPPCNHLTVVRADPSEKHHCTSCGEAMIVMPTSRAVWAEMGRRLQGARRRAPAKGKNAQRKLAL